MLSFFESSEFAFAVGMIVGLLLAFLLMTKIVHHRVWRVGVGLLAILSAIAAMIAACKLLWLGDQTLVWFVLEVVALLTVFLWTKPLAGIVLDDLAVIYKNAGSIGKAPSQSEK